MSSTLMRILAILVSIAVTGAFTQSPGLKSSSRQQVADLTLLSVGGPTEFGRDANKKRCDPCERMEEDDNDDLDRREALFAMMGNLWAVGVLPASLLAPQAAHAEAGAEAKIRLPNPLEQMEDRATKQCLMESLGNRECLVYMGDGDKVYQGLDNTVLVQRLEKSLKALASIPDLVDSKKWSQVTGVMTGPLGELVRTMGQLADASQEASSAILTKKIKLLKTDLYALQAAVDRKDGAKALTAHASATQNLVEFLQAL